MLTVALLSPQLPGSEVCESVVLLNHAPSHEPIDGAHDQLV